MKRKQQILITAVSAIGILITSTVSTAYAMKDGGYKGKRHNILRMAEALQLTDTQKESIQLLQEQFKADKAAWRKSNQDADRETKREAKRALLEAYKAQIKGILTDEQEAKLKELKQNRKDKKHKHSDN